MIKELFYIFVFPGFCFLLFFSTTVEYFDRKLHARMQNRIGPPWYQPIADFIKLVGKEDIMPGNADASIFRLMPVFALAAPIAAYLYIPLWGKSALFSFGGDVIVVLYLLTLPTLSFFLAGWYSRSVYSMIGAVRGLTQLFAYEVPLFVCILAPAMLADTWSLSQMTVFYGEHPWYWLFNLLGFAIGFIALLGKLEKVPFDIPEAETEIVAGSFTEYGGRLYAFFRAALNVEMIVGASLLAAVFLPFGLSFGPKVGFAIYLVKLFGIISLISLARTIMARLRIDQMINLCWKCFAPLAFLQLLINLILKRYL